MTGHPDDRRETPQWLETGEAAKARRLACLVRPGDGPPVVWLGGFRSDMRATKAEALADWARAEDAPSCASTMPAMAKASADFARWTLSDWRDDALAVIAAHCRQPPVLVGSSMGAGSRCSPRASCSEPRSRRPAWC